MRVNRYFVVQIDKIVTTLTVMPVVVASVSIKFPFFLITCVPKMEADKENVCHTKIPLPKHPLPALPKHLLAENKLSQKQDHIPPRIPLKTLNSQIYQRAGPSKNFNKPNFLMNIDTRFVTQRRRSEDLDWSYNVLKDKKAEKDSSIISISDDELYLDKENQRHFVDKKKNDLGDMLSAVTPNLKAALEPNRIRNIKRSLKRPHSRELQGLSPLLKQNKPDDKVKRRLKFNENLQDRLDSSDYWKRSYMRCLNRDYTVDIFDNLLAVEKKPLEVPRISNITRACIINWLMKVNGVDGSPSTIQTACWYLDSILGTGSVHLEKLQLVAAACYWIAQKIHGPVAPATRLVKCANNAFTANKLVRAEKVILERLKFPQQPVVYQDYITYLCWYCDQLHGGETEMAATFLCMCGLMVDKSLCEEFPSVVAAAAVRNALLLLRKKDLMSRLHLCNVFKAADKKATKLTATCSILRRAVRTVAAPIYEYKTPLEHYSFPPSCIAQRIVSAANELAVLDIRNIERMN